MNQTPCPGDLRAALRDLGDATDEAQGEGFPIPSDAAISNAHRLIRRIYEIAPGRYEVYPTPDGEIAVDVSGRRGSVVLLCDSLGGVLSLVNLEGTHRRARHSSSRTLPDRFICEALADLDG